MGESVFELEAAAADVLEVGAEEADGGGCGDGGAGLVDALIVDEDAAGEDKGLGALAGGGVAVVDEEFIEAKLFAALFCDAHRFFLCKLADSQWNGIYLFMVTDVVSASI